MNTSSENDDAGLGPPPGSDPGLAAALARVIDPEIRRPITELGMIGRATLHDGVADVQLRLTIAGCPAARAIERDTREAAGSASGVDSVELEVTVMSPEERTRLTTALRGNRRASPFGPGTLTRIVAVTSGKGGVGKSTLTANLAVALAAEGLAVGLIDADVFGFSIPGILGIPEAKPTRVGELILPPVAHEVKTISIGMFVDAGQAVAWRGPMLHRTIEQFLRDVYFGDLDVLLLDLPPGTGDVAISLGQLLPHAEVLVVTTPQTAAAEVAERSGLVARKTGQTVIGVVENMAGLAGPDGEVIELFGSGGGRLAAERLGVPLMASIPLSVALREGGDSGVPIVIGDPEDAAAARILELADALGHRPRGLAGRPLPLSF